MAIVRTLSDIENIEQHPLTDWMPTESTYELLALRATTIPDNTAMQFFFSGQHYQQAKTWTYRQLFETVTQTANFFHALGVGKEDVIAYLLPNLPQTQFCLWGGQAAGIVTPINPLLEFNYIAHILRASGCKVLVTLAPTPGLDLWEKALKACQQVTTINALVTVKLTAYLPWAKSLIANYYAYHHRRRSSLTIPVYDFDKAIKHYNHARLDSGRQFQGDDIAAYFHSGGTTGYPKIIKHTHFNQIVNAKMCDVVLDGKAGSQFFCGLPLFHVNAVVINTLIAWVTEGSVILGSVKGYRDEYVIKYFWRIVEHYKINYFSAVPTIYSALLDVPINDHDISSLKEAICGAAPMPVDIFKRFEKMTAVKIIEGYGLTETTCVAGCNPNSGERRVGSVGFRLPYQQLKTVKIDDDDHYQCDCDIDEIGEIIFRGVNITTGYLQQENNKKAWLNCGDGAPWFRSGDLGRLDKEGYLWLTGRQKELIIRGGHNIDPAIVETPFYQLPDVVLAIAVARPEPRVGEVVALYVQLKDNSQCDEATLYEFAKQHIQERAALPKKITIINEVPLTAVGKVFKPQLQWLEVKDVFSEELNSIDNIEHFTIDVAEDRKRGMLATMTVTKTADSEFERVRQAIEHRLGHYAIAYELNLS